MLFYKAGYTHYIGDAFIECRTKPSQLMVAAQAICLCPVLPVIFFVSQALRE